MPVLGVDLGQTIGWFLGDAVGPCRWGSFKAEKTTDLHRWLRSVDAPLQQILPHATAIAIEQPWMGDNWYPLRKLAAQLGHVHYHAGFAGIPSAKIKEIPVATAKYTLAGHGRADKDMMIAAAAADGYEGMDEHAADAYGIWKTYVFGERERPAKAKTRSSKPVSVKP